MATKKNNDLISQLLSSSVVSSLASSTGSSKKDVTSVLSDILPSLLSGADSQKNNAKTASSFLSALTSHSQKEESSLFDSLDLADGAKIVSHLLGKDSDQEVEKTSEKTGISSEVVSKITSAAAPVLMAYLGKQVLSSTSSSKKTSGTSSKKTTNNKKTSKSKTASKPKTSKAKKTTTKSKSKKSSSILDKVDVGDIINSILK